MNFKPIENITEEEKAGFLFLFSESFVHPEFNTSGIIDGFYQDGEGWIGAVWNTQDDGGCWKDTVVEPTHYCLKVKPVFTDNESNEPVCTVGSGLNIGSE